MFYGEMWLAMTADDIRLNQRPTKRQQAEAAARPQQPFTKPPTKNPELRPAGSCPLLVNNRRHSSPNAYTIPASIAQNLLYNPG